MHKNFERRHSGLIVPRGKFQCTLIRAGDVVDEWSADNIVVNEGLNHMIGVELGAATQLTSWFLGLFSGNYTPVASDAAATFVGSATEVTTITNTSRPIWTPATAAGQSITNAASQATFTFNAAGSVYGAFLSSSAVLGSAVGTLFSAARFSAVKTVAVNDQLLMTYTLSAASS